MYWDKWRIRDEALTIPFALSRAGGEASAEAAASVNLPTADDLDF